MSGTNAHALVRPASGAAPRPTDTVLPWRRDRAWPGPRPPPLIVSASIDPHHGGVEYAVSLTGPSLAWLLDHRVGGTALLPGAAMVEAATAAALTLVGDGVRAAPALALTGITFAVPLVLDGGDRAPATVRLLVDAGGGVALVSTRGGGGARLTHAAARAARVAVLIAPRTRATCCLQRLTVASKPSLTPVAIAAVAARSAGRGFACGPAALDASLHLGPSLYPAGTTARVPTGVAAVRLPPFADVAPSTGWAVAGPRGDPRGLSDHTLAGRTGAATLAGLTSATAPASKRRRSPWLYDMGWQVDEVARPMCARPARALPCRRPKRALAAALAGLQLNARHNAPTHLVVWGGDAAIGDGPAGPPRGGTSGAAVAALARVAAGEGAPVSVAEMDALSATSSVPPSYDAFGAAAGGGAVCVPRAAPAQVSSPAPAATAHPHTALIVGGLGGLGSLAASWLTAACPGALAIVAGRTAHVRPPSTLPNAVAVAADASTRADAADLATMVPPNRTSLALLAAGVLADGGVAGATPAALRAAAAPKPAALAALTLAWIAAAPRAGVHMYGSIAAVVGSAGQAAYAAANGATAAAAATLVARGTPATTLQWGAWSGTGMAASSASALARAARAGLGVVVPTHGLAALAAALAGRLAWSVAPLASPMAWDALARAAGATGLPAALASGDDSEPVAAAERKAAEAVPSPLPTRRVTRAAVADIVVTTLASILGTTLPPSARLMDAGLDSLGAGELRAALASALRVPLPATLAFDCPTPEALVDGLVKSVARQRKQRVWRRWPCALRRAPRRPPPPPLSPCSPSAPASPAPRPLPPWQTSQRLRTTRRPPPPPTGGTRTRCTGRGRRGRHCTRASPCTTLSPPPLTRPPSPSPRPKPPRWTPGYACCWRGLRRRLDGRVGAFSRVPKPSAFSLGQCTPPPTVTSSTAVAPPSPPPPPPATRWPF